MPLITVSPITVFFLLVIGVCTLFTLLFNSVTAKLGRLENGQKELESQQRKRFDLEQQTEATQEALSLADSAVESARESLETAIAVYNESISRFPGLIVAGIFGFEAILSGEEGFSYGDDDF